MKMFVLFILIFFVAGISCYAKSTIDGRFGKAVFDEAKPAITELYLMEDGGLDTKSILSSQEFPWLRGVSDFGTQGYTFIFDTDNNRYESRFFPAKVKKTDDKIIISDIRLASSGDAKPVAEEKWIIEVKKDTLKWTVERTYLKDIDVKFSGMPVIYTTNRPYKSDPSTVVDNAVSSTFWYDTDYIEARFEPFYRQGDFARNDYKISRNNNLLITKKNTWAIFKLFANWDLKSDLRLAVDNGYIVNRGHFSWVNEIGATANRDYSKTVKTGTKERVSLILSPVSRKETGYQLSINIPNKEVEYNLEKFFSTLYNGALVCDNKTMHYGNETFGWYYSGANWLQGKCLSVSVPSEDKVSEHSFTHYEAFRDKLAGTIGTMMEDGRTHYGYDPTGSFTDENLQTIDGFYDYIVHTGDVDFLRLHILSLEKMVKYYDDFINDKGLYDFKGMGHWYYDAMPTSGMNACHNAYLFRIYKQMSEFFEILGDNYKAEVYSNKSANLKEAFNREFWTPDAEGGARFADWITSDGEKVTYGADITLFMPIAIGIADSEKAKAALETLNRRTEEIKKDYGYRHILSVSSYWKIPDRFMVYKWQEPYGTYMNGASFLCQTYWELMARCKYGDSDTAYRMLSDFSKEAAKHSFLGNNHFTQQMEIGPGASDEPYLSDMVVVPVAMVRGIMGISFDWKGINVNPNLPMGMDKAETQVIYKGDLYNIKIENGKVDIQKIKKVYDEFARTYRVAGSDNPEWYLWIDKPFNYGNPEYDKSIDLHNGYRVSLARKDNPGDFIGYWKLDAIHSESVLEYKNDANGITSGGLLIDENAVKMNGNGNISVSSDLYFFSGKDSFTIEADVKTVSNEINVLVSRPLEYCLYIKNGKLAGWIMNAGSLSGVVEITGDTVINDNNWHHISMVVNRDNQTMRLFVNGKEDAYGNISNAFQKNTGTSLYIGSLGSGYYYNGLIKNVAVHKKVLDTFAVDSPYETQERYVKSYYTSGIYSSDILDWITPCDIKIFTANVRLNGQKITAIIEASDSDNFIKTVSKKEVSLKDGDNLYEIGNLVKSRYVRVKFLFKGTKNISSELLGFSLKGE